MVRLCPLVFLFVKIVSYIVKQQEQIILWEIGILVIMKRHWILPFIVWKMILQGLSFCHKCFMERTNLFMWFNSRQWMKTWLRNNTSSKLQSIAVMNKSWFTVVIWIELRCSIQESWMFSLSMTCGCTWIDSSDDDKIVKYLWEEMSGPLQDHTLQDDRNMLTLKDLVPGYYVFKWVQPINTDRLITV